VLHKQWAEVLSATTTEARQPKEQAVKLTSAQQRLLPVAVVLSKDCCRSEGWRLQARARRQPLDRHFTARPTLWGFSDKASVTDWEGHPGRIKMRIALTLLLLCGLHGCTAVFTGSRQGWYESRPTVNSCTDYCRTWSEDGERCITLRESVTRRCVRELLGER